MAQGWMRGHFGLDASRGQTHPVIRTVLVVVHTMVAGTRLADIVPLLERDRRIQVVYTQAPAAVFGNGVERFLRRGGGLTIPWEQATRTPFDLALAATFGSLEYLHARIMTLPHGVGYGKYTPRWDGAGARAPRPLAGAVRQRLTAYGRVTPSVIALAHEDQRARLAVECPESLPAVRVVGDPTFDRLLIADRDRMGHRRAFAVGGGRRLVVVSSTWAPGSLLGSSPELLARLASELPPDRYRLVGVLHPNIWAWHGRRQVRAWFDDCSRAGVLLLPPEEGWHAALAAADLVVGDHGSVTCYAAGLGRPVLLASFPDADVDPDSHVATLGRTAPRLDDRRPLRSQIAAAILDHSPARYGGVRRLISSAPHQAASRIRMEMYTLMDLPEPAGPARMLTVPCVTDVA